MEWYFAQITPLLNRLPSTYAAFDCDNTTIHNDIAQATLVYVCRNQLLRNDHIGRISAHDKKEYHESVFSYIMDLEEGPNPLHGYKEMARAFAGFSPDELRLLAREVIRAKSGMQQIGRRKIDCTLQPVEETTLIRNYLADHGIENYLVSASPISLVEGVALEFKFSAKVLGMRNVITNDVLTTEIEEPHCGFEGKVANLEKYVHAETKPHTRPLVAMGDSLNDFPLLDYAYLPIIINRNNTLLDIARQRGWPIIHPRIS